MKSTIFGITLWCLAHAATAQDTVRYTGQTLSNVDYHHGQLMPAVGTHNIQVFRANREFPDLAGGHGFTYNHQPFLAYWNNTYYLQFLSNPIGEHIAEGKTLLLTSKDGYAWSEPQELFPPYLVPEGFTKPGRTDKAGKNLYAIMHQRMGFYTAKNGKLLTIGYYGVALDAKDDPNDGNGIGRVVREIKTDGSFGPIYFIRFNSSFDQKLAQYPLYTKSKDKAFVAACKELLNTPLMMQQWVEEADRDDPLVPYKRPIKAFAYYHLKDGRVVGLWKHALTSISNDNGRTWAYGPLRAPGFVNSNAKIWGQKTSDGRYATVYNPSEFRWPLAVSTSDDGLSYTDLLLVNGEITTMRYGGNYKSYGPQYVRGILEGNGTPPDGNMWLTYSMNKEDMWVAKVPVPITAQTKGAVADDFKKNGEEAFNSWNIYSPLWASVKVEGGELVLRDKDPYDYAKAERIIEPSKKVKIAFTVTPKQVDHGNLQVELVNNLGLAAARIVFDADGIIKNKAGYRMASLQSYEAGKTYHVVLTVDVDTRSYQIRINGTDKGTRLFFQPVSEISRVSFRTGDVRRYPDADTPTDQDFDVKNAGTTVKEAVFGIAAFEAEKRN
ncbi:BNR repeat protein [Sphingobacterium allocomposti]|uniref:BNR repeat protein n=1 Tax=Sphingobacterium allocomposti TaxID=415956 RepID=A0A5S5DMA2_9SPHI|nr:exo-alpha-sialidase [Sphingobacterium composti Yoo et al. 2007 non Ten et al. 2007]TYP95859.1 BNR repeat protein [Sphingobacterium composti Yoo et al. 2007 non Ten et al. 2007]